jgi:ribosomal protein S18 acetylase RimI-like enzyme
MSARMEELTPEALPSAIEGSLFDLFESWSHWPKAHIEDGGDHLRLVADIPTSLFNGIFRIHMPAEHLDARIGAALAPFRARDMPAFWLVGPTTEPADLAARLQAHGARRLDDAVGMAADLHAVRVDAGLPAGLTIERVRDEELLRHYNDAMNRGFGSPAIIRDGFLQVFTSLGQGDDQPWRHYVGLMDGHAVASSSLLLGTHVAGIYNVATVEEARGQGIGTAMTVAALREAQAQGYRVAVLHASAAGVGIYQRLGFATYCTIRWLESQP